MRKILVFAVFGFCVGVQAFDVRDFGAVGDGKTDDTAAIQKALNHIGKRIKYDRFRQEDGWYKGSTETHVDELRFPAGTYLISRTLLADGSVSLRGEKGKTIIKMTDPKSDILFCRLYRRAIFDGIVFDGGATQIDLWSRNWNASTVHVTECSFRNSSAPAFRSVSLRVNYPDDWTGKKRGIRMIPTYEVEMKDGVPHFTRQDISNSIAWYSSNTITIRDTEFFHCTRAFEVNNDGTMLDNCAIVAAPDVPGAVCLVGVGPAPNMLTLRNCRLTAPAGAKAQYWFRNNGFYLTLRECSFESASPMALIEQETHRIPGYSTAGNIVIAGCKIRQGAPARPLVTLRRVTSTFVFRDNAATPEAKLFDWAVKPDKRYFEYDSFRGKHQGIPWPTDRKYHFVFGENRGVTVNCPAVVRRFVHKDVPQLHTVPEQVPPLPVGFAGELRAVDLGVVPDGKTDNADAMERALAAAEKAGKTLIVPQGRIRLGRTVRLPRRVSLRGEGMPIVFGDTRTGYDLFRAEDPVDIRFRNLILRNGERILSAKLNRESRCVVFHDTVIYDTGKLSILLTGRDNHCRLDLVGSLWNGAGGIDSAAAYNTVSLCWFANNFWMDDMAFFTVRQGTAILQNGFFVPYVSKNVKRTNLRTDETKVWPLGGHLRWVDNAGAKVFLYDCRGGGEAGGYCSYYHTAPGGFAVIEGGLARVTNKDTRNVIVYAEAAPQWILLAGVGGYPVHTLSGVRQRIWSKAPGAGKFPVFDLGSMTPQEGPDGKEDIKP